MRIARQQGDPEQLRSTLNNYASRALATGRTEIDAYRGAVANARAAEFGSGALAAGGLALSYVFAGDLEAARVANDRVSEIAGAHALAKTTADAVAAAVTLAFESGETQNIGALFISERTVETHIAAIFDRFDLNSRKELARLLEALP
ncbi:MAG TPA: LuxR C-terminal-related transcriptional regulator [Candidatus Baltobacteraceae bacterium]|nr:LuxR C-terminal-related transcriptional regulator [Candidatus Baltobacteraceae bacterium]